MGFWSWCTEHYIIAGLLAFCALCILDQMQANYFNSRRRR